MKSQLDNKIPAQYQTKWEEFQPQGMPVKSIIVVLHGLNQIPMDMDDLCARMAQNGHYMVRGFLSGHEGKEFDKIIEDGDWEQDTLSLIKYGQGLAEHFNVKLNTLAFSTGNLCFLNALNDYEENNIHKAVMIAPPIVMTPLGGMARTFVLLPDNVVIPSPDPQNNSRACANVNASYYKAFFKAKDYFHRNLNQRHNIPMLLMGHIHDEIINTSKFDHFISKYNLDNWETFTLNDDKMRKDSYYHIIVSTHYWGSIAHRIVQKASSWLEN